MPIIRVTRKQIQVANKAREAALTKDEDFRRHEEKQRQRFEQANKVHEAPLQNGLKSAAAREEEQPWFFTGLSGYVV